MSYRIPYLVGTKRGVTHFPGEFISVDGAPANFPDSYTPAVDLVFATACLWHVKKWHVTGSLILYSDTGLHEQEGEMDLDYFIQYFNADFSLGDDEPALLSLVGDVSKPTFLWNPGAFGPIDDTSVVFSGDPVSGITPGSLFVTSSLFGDSRIIYDSDDNLYLLINPSHIVHCPFPGAAFQIVDPKQANDTNIPAYIPGASPPLVSIPVTIDPGITAPLVTNRSLYAAEEFIGGTRYTSGSITYTAVEFWPYADRNGDPVYDTATGAQLRDPLG